MREQSLPLTAAPDLLELRISENFNTKEHSSLIEMFEELTYPFEIVNINFFFDEEKIPITGKVFFINNKEYKSLQTKISKNKDSWFILLEEEVKGEYLDVKNLIVLDNETKKQIPNLLGLINEHFFNAKKAYLCMSAKKNLRLLGKDAIIFLEDIQGSYQKKGEDLGAIGLSALQVMEDLLGFYGDFFIIEDLPDLEMLIKKVVSKSKIVKTIQIFEDFDSLIEEDKGGGMILPLIHGEKQALAFYRFPKRISAIAPLYTYFMHSLLSISFGKLYPASEEGENALWHEAFSKFPFPCALVSETGELILHNPLFSKLSLSPVYLSKFKNLEKIEVEGKVLELRRMEINRRDHKCNLLILMSNNQKLDTPGSSEELGIISSSIAHELNNPLAGILATIAVLGLEDEWLIDPEVSGALDEMNQSGRRCKDLIEIFLGFSRAQPNMGDANQVKEVFKKSLELIRFRTIESSVRFEFDIDHEGEGFRREINGSVLSMMFYLILNEILTSFSHHKLISSDKTNLLTGQFSESSSKVIIEMDKKFSFEKNINDSKLIQHLLDLVGMSLQVDRGKIILSEWTLT